MERSSNTVAEAEIGSVMSITNCSEDVAKRALTKYRDATEAISAYLDAGGWDSLSITAPNQNVQAPPHSWMSFSPEPADDNHPSQTPQAGPATSSGAKEQPPGYSQTRGDAENPIEISDEEEPSDIQRAIQASRAEHERLVSLRNEYTSSSSDSESEDIEIIGEPCDPEERARMRRDLAAKYRRENPLPPRDAQWLAKLQLKKWNYLVKDMQQRIERAKRRRQAEGADKTQERTEATVNIPASQMNLEQPTPRTEAAANAQALNRDPEESDESRLVLDKATPDAGYPDANEDYQSRGTIFIPSVPSQSSTAASSAHRKRARGTSESINRPEPRLPIKQRLCIADSSEDEAIDPESSYGHPVRRQVSQPSRSSLVHTTVIPERPPPTPVSVGRTLRDRATLRVPVRGAALLSGSSERAELEALKNSARPRSPPRRYDLSAWTATKMRKQLKTLDQFDCLEQPHPQGTDSCGAPASIYDLMQLQRQYLPTTGERIGRTNRRGRMDESNANLDEEDAMDRAIANSLELSQNDGTREAQPCDLPDERRDPAAPVALFTHIPTLMPVAYALQAILSSSAAQRALLQFRPGDDRIWNGIEGYHKGLSPANMPYRDRNSFRSLDLSVRQPFDLTWRLQVLCAFCLHSTRARCNVGDLVASIPQEVLRINSKGNEPSTVVPSYYGRLVESFYHASRFIHDTKWKMSDDDEQAMSSWNDVKSTFHCIFRRGGSLATSSTLEEGDHGIIIRPDNVACTVTSAMQVSLHSQKATFVQVPKLLAVDIRPQEHKATPGQRFVHLTVEPLIYLDRFLASRSQSVDEDQGDLSREVRKVQRLILMRERQLEELTTQAAVPVMESLRDSIDYFDTTCRAGDDRLRAQSQSEVAAELQVLERELQDNITDLTSSLSADRMKLANLWKAIQERQRRLFDAPEWKTVKYSLTAKFMVAPDQQWLYFRTDSGWWQNLDGEVRRASIDDVLDDKRGCNSSARPTFLLYDQVSDESGRANLPDVLQDKIDQDNELLEGTLLSMRQEHDVAMRETPLS